MTKPQDRKGLNTATADAPGPVPRDILRRATKDFGPKLGQEIYRSLLDRIPDNLPNGTRPRHLRCILYLAKGSKKLLDRYIGLCLLDTRDLMLEAEYEIDSKSRLVRRRDFAKPFDQSKITRS